MNDVGLRLLHGHSRHTEEVVVVVVMVNTSTGGTRVSTGMEHVVVACKVSPLRGGRLLEKLTLPQVRYCGRKEKKQTKNVRGCRKLADLQAFVCGEGWIAYREEHVKVASLCVWEKHQGRM